MVKGKEKFWIGGDYEVKEADYKTDTKKESLSGISNRSICLFIQK